jgi:hypothetical protein
MAFVNQTNSGSCGSPWATYNPEQLDTETEAVRSDYMHARRTGSDKQND